MEVGTLIDYNMETICVRNVYGGKTYVLTYKDKTGDYCDLQAYMENLYDYYSGEPINEEVKKMDNCILKDWNPDLFEELFYKLTKNTDLRIV
jgi:hypothetical protein